MCVVKDISGEKFGNYLVIERTKRTDAKQRAFWKCKCLGCNKYYEVRGDLLRLGVSSSCRGCSTTRGGKKSREII